jgi:hypothetical protein
MCQGVSSNIIELITERDKGQLIVTTLGNGFVGANVSITIENTNPIEPQITFQSYRQPIMII